ncbi:MAG: tyrosine-type recombinase/integrase, partial [Planktothrix sp.]
LLEMWLHNKSVGTVQIYRRVWNQFFRFSQKSIQAITVSDLMTWVEAISPTLKPATVKSKLYAIKSLLSFANRVGYTPFNVGAVIKPPSVAAGIHRKCLQPAQIKAMAGSVESIRDSLLIRLGYLAGLRASEIAGLTWSCLHNGILTLVGKGGKERSIRLPEAISNDLLKFKPVNARDNSPMFISRVKKGHLNRSSITRIIKQAAIKAGESDKVSAHWLRHSHAYNALQSGVSVTLIRDTLGHSSLATTSQYLAISPEDSSAMALSI